MFAFKVQLIDRLTGTRYKMWPLVIKQVFIGILGTIKEIEEWQREFTRRVHVEA